MKHEELITRYLTDSKVMQIATVSNGKPWICTVYYVTDSAKNIYWVSLPTRRHSIEIAADPHAAVAIAVKRGQPIIGIQAEGTVETVSDIEAVKDIMEKYIAKHGMGQNYYDNFVAGISKHILYKFIPTRIVLFDEVEFPPNSPQELLL